MPKLTREDLTTFFNFGVDLPVKTLYIGEKDGVEHTMAEKVVKGLHLLDSINRKKVLTILMNNDGGDEYHGLAIYDAIKSCKSKTRIKVFGSAMSMGAWILQAADQRWLHKNTTLMLHYGETNYSGHTKNYIKFSEENKRLVKLSEDHLLERIKEKHPRYTRETLQELINFDKYLTATQAVELGLADKVI